MIRFKYDFKNATIKAVECEIAGYRAKDADGDTQYANTHFNSPAEAWDELEREIVAALSLGTGEREQTRDHLAEVTARLADDAERLVAMKANREKWES